MRRLLFIAAASMVASPAFAYVQLGQSQAKELILALMEDAKLKIGENKKDIALTQCVAARELLLRKFPMPPSAVVDVIKATCQPLFEEVKVEPASAKAAMDKYSEQISDMSFLMTVGPLGGGYDGSRKDMERIIGASKMEVEAFKLATDFVALLPRPSRDEEVAQTGVDVDELKLRRLELWNLIWGATFAEAMITEKIVPQLAATLKKANSDATAGNNDRVVLSGVENTLSETAELLGLAAPDGAERKEADALLKKVRERIDVLYAKEVDAQRMPKDNYKGADRAALEAIVKKAALGEYKAVLRIVFPGDGWTAPETVGWWDANNRFHWSKTKTLVGGGSVAVETKDKGITQFRMVSVSFSDSWNWDTRRFEGPRVSFSWGPPILKKHVSK